MAFLLGEDTTSTTSTTLGTTSTTGTPSSEPPSRRLSWADLALLTLVLGVLTVLLVVGVGLPQALAIVGAGGLVTVELRRRLSQS